VDPDPGSAEAKGAKGNKASTNARAKTINGRDRFMSTFIRAQA
jgi:hypothetical protein